MLNSQSQEKKKKIIINKNYFIIFKLLSYTNNMDLKTALKRIKELEDKNADLEEKLYRANAL